VAKVGLFGWNFKQKEDDNAVELKNRRGYSF